MSSNLNIQNILDHCRVCLTELKNSQHLDVRLDFDASLTFNEVFKLLTQTDLLADGLPHFICQECGVELQLSYELYKRVQESTKILLQLREQQTEKLQLTALNLASSQEDAEQPAIDEIEEFESITQEDFELESLEEEHIEFEVNETHSSSNCSSAKYNAQFSTTKDESADEISQCEFQLKKLPNRTTKPKCLNTENIGIVESEHHVYRTTSDREKELCEKNFKSACRRAPRAEGPPFKCEECNHVSKSRALLSSHRHRKHRIKERQLSCTRGCSKLFDTKQQLQRHLKRKTCETYPTFECSECGKKCIGVANYEVHMRFHKKAYKYECHLCPKKFLMKTHFNDHFRAKHEMRRFICEQPSCGKLFQSVYALRMHAYTHSEMPFECKYCKRGCPTLSKLRFHIRRVHTFDLSDDDLHEMCVNPDLRVTTSLTSVQYFQKFL